MRKFGPGILVAAAFIGPGTVTTASLAGANFGFALVWALIFSIFTTIVLQNMASRLGIVSQNGLATALRNSIAHPIVRLGVLILIVAAIGIGNAAYQGGNILGAALAANLLTDIPTSILAIVMGALAFSLLFSGRYRLIETCLIILVSLMSVVFIACVVLNPPDWHLMVSQLIPNDISQFSNVMVIALIGTTVVPYNLFLHARAAQEKWKDVDTMQALQEAKIDTSLSIGMGG
ncbi:MAG: manganese transport protein, partial [Candidatus Azotimanducaceae bacterium]